MLSPVSENLFLGICDGRSGVFQRNPKIDLTPGYPLAPISRAASTVPGQPWEQAKRNPPPSGLNPSGAASVGRQFPHPSRLDSSRSRHHALPTSVKVHVLSGGSPPDAEGPLSIDERLSCRAGGRWPPSTE